MSLDINQIALHQLIKRDEQNLELVLRDSLLEPTETVVEMVAELHRVYSAKNKAYGLFSEESELAQTLRLQRQGEEDFLAFSRAGAMTTAKITPMSVVSLRRCLTPITSLPLRSRWSVPAYKSMKNTVIIWRARPLPAPGIFHVCWDGKVPLTYKPHNNGEHHDPTKN